ncbi:hypothetical protein CsatB_012686 [Cannabis sativa]
MFFADLRLEMNPPSTPPPLLAPSPVDLTLNFFFGIFDMRIGQRPLHHLLVP